MSTMGLEGMCICNRQKYDNTVGEFMKSLCTRILKYPSNTAGTPSDLPRIKTKTIQVSGPGVQIPDNRVWWLSRASEDLLFLTAADIIPVAMSLSGMLQSSYCSLKGI